MVSIHLGALMRVEGVDYRVEGREVVFPTPPGAVLDICAGCAWPERFDRTEIQKRRKAPRTLNAWDSQSGLEAHPLTAVRLDPTPLTQSPDPPFLRAAHGPCTRSLGPAPRVACACPWPPPTRHH